jgi:hypothetical protein
VPVPLAFFHLFSHLKTVGRYGVPGLTALASLWIFRQRPAARVYLSALFLMSLLGHWGMLVMERYWLLLLPIQALLFLLLSSYLRERLSRYRLPLGWIVLGSALVISLVNYFFRYYPASYQRLGEILLK